MQQLKKLLYLILLLPAMVRGQNTTTLPTPTTSYTPQFRYYGAAADTLKQIWVYSGSKYNRWYTATEINRLFALKSDTTSFNNGLTKTAGIVQLGGNLIQDSQIGLDGHSFGFSDAQTLFSVSNSLNRIASLDAKNKVYGLFVTSDQDGNGNGSISIGKSNLSTTEVAIGFDSTGVSVYDPFHNKGLFAKGNYEANYTSKSYTSKRYVDSVATGGGTGFVAKMPSGFGANITGAAGQGFVQLPKQSVSPSSSTDNLRIYADSLNRLSWKNSNYRRTIRVTRPSDMTISVPYRLNPTLADSTDIYNGYIRNTTTQENKNLSVKRAIANRFTADSLYNQTGTIAMRLTAGSDPNKGGNIFIAHPTRDYIEPGSNNNTMVASGSYGVINPPDTTYNRFTLRADYRSLFGGYDNRADSSISTTFLGTAHGRVYKLTNHISMVGSQYVTSTLGSFHFYGGAVQSSMDGDYIGIYSTVGSHIYKKYSQYAVIMNSTSAVLDSVRTAFVAASPSFTADSASNNIAAINSNSGKITGATSFGGQINTNSSVLRAGQFNGQGWGNLLRTFSSNYTLNAANNGVRISSGTNFAALANTSSIYTTVTRSIAAGGTGNNVTGATGSAFIGGSNITALFSPTNVIVNGANDVVIGDAGSSGSRDNIGTVNIGSYLSSNTFAPYGTLHSSTTGSMKFLAGPGVTSTVTGGGTWNFNSTGSANALVNNVANSLFTLASGGYFLKGGNITADAIIKAPNFTATGLTSGASGTDSLLVKNATTNVISKISPTYYAPTANPSFTNTTTVQGFRAAYKAVTAATTFGTGDFGVNVTSGTFTQALPATPFSGQIYGISNSGTGVVTVTATGMSGLTSVILNQGDWLTVQFTGTSGVYDILSMSRPLIAGNGIGITQSNNTYTISAIGNPVVEIAGTTQSANGNTIYIPHNASLTTISVPATTAIGTLYQTIGEGAGGWRMNLPAGAVAVGVGGFTTTSGGSLSSTDRYCTITIRYAATNKFVVTTSQGTITPL